MTPEEQAERLEQAIADGREVLREIHSASKDLRRTLKEARDLLASDIAAQMAAEVQRQVEALGEQTQEAMRKAVEKVNTEFDKLGAILLGLDQAEPLEDMIRKVAALPGRRSVQPYEKSVAYDTDVLEQHP